MGFAVEKYNGRKITTGQNASVEVEYLVFDEIDESLAMAALLAEAPETWGNAPIQSTSLEQIHDSMWIGTVTWGFTQLTPPTEEEGESTTSFSTKGGKAKITQSRGTTAYAKSGETAPDFKGAIGVTKDSVEGVEITVPALQFSKTRRFPPGWLTSDRVKALSRLTGSTNQTTFLGFAPGELIFEGCEGTQKDVDEPVDVKFDFIGSQNVTGQTYGDITGVNKLGWQYLWFLYQESEDATAKAVVKRPIACYVETVLPAADFSGIGI